MTAILPEEGHEYDANGHYVIGPRLKQPSLWLFIAEAQGTLVVPDAPAQTGRERKRRKRIALAMHERRQRLARAITEAR